MPSEADVAVYDALTTATKKLAAGCTREHVEAYVSARIEPFIADTTLLAAVVNEIVMDAHIEAERVRKERGQ